MYMKTFYFALIALLLTSVIDAKKSRRNKRPREEEDSTPQPNVVTYSTFGFNDVGSYDGFIPSSPDYTNFIRNISPESSAPTRLYAPAFPTALDHEGYDSGFSSQDTQPSASASGPSDDNIPQASMLHQYPQRAVSFYNTPSLESSDPRNQHGVVNELFGHNVGEVNAPIYGAKIGSRNRNKSVNNNTEENVFSSGSSSPMDVKYSTFHEVHSSFENKQPNFGEPDKNYQNHFSYLQNYSPTDSENAKKVPSSTQNPLKFPRVIDFTKFKQYYPSGAESKITSTPKPTTTTTNYNPWQNQPYTNEHGYTNNFEDFRTKFPGTLVKDSIKEIDNSDKSTQSPPLMYTDVDYSQNSNFGSLNTNKETKYEAEYKDKFKYKPWSSTNFTDNDYKNWKNPLKGYQYSTNASNMTFEFDFSGVKKPVQDQNQNINDEVVPESTNVDVSSYHFPETDYSTFKKIPPIKGSFGDFKNYEEDFENSYQSLKNNKYDPADYVKSLYSFSTVPTTPSHLGNIYKTAEFNSYKHHVKKPPYFEEANDEIVHIPKRPYGNKYNFGKYTDSKPTSEWSSYSSNRLHKYKKNKESTRFKSEEDLLGLRTHDTSHPSHLPTYKPNSLSNDDYDYKKLVEKWRQSYLKAKYKDFAHDFESYSSEPKPIHVPVPKPYAIEVPHPVIVPVPQPYPVRVPVPKPVAVPVVQELTVPVEKPVPYPVVKNVPYPVEKYVPVKVEKEVKVPVMKPYPVPIPQIRPVFHYTRHRDKDEEEPVDEEEEYGARPESSKKVPYAKRLKSFSSRHRSRSPTRTHRQPHHSHSYKDRESHSYREREPHSYRERVPHSYGDREPHPYRERQREIHVYRDREERNRRRWPSRHTSSRLPELHYWKRSPEELRPQPFRRPSGDMEEQEYEPEYRAM